MNVYTRIANACFEDVRHLLLFRLDGFGFKPQFSFSLIAQDFKHVGLFRPVLKIQVSSRAAALCAEPD